jgi:hypothetical protein
MFKANRAVVFLYAALGVVLAFLFASLSILVEVEAVSNGPASTPSVATVLGIARSRNVVLKLSSLFGLDSFAGGFWCKALRPIGSICVLAWNLPHSARFSFGRTCWPASPPSLLLGSQRGLQFRPEHCLAGSSTLQSAARDSLQSQSISDRAEDRRVGRAVSCLARASVGPTTSKMFLVSPYRWESGRAAEKRVFSFTLVGNPSLI